MGLFASIPLPDVDAALQEAEYALDTLELRAGDVLMSNVHGHFWVRRISIGCGPS